MVNDKNMSKKLEQETLREVCEWLTNKGVFFWRCNNAPTPRFYGGKLKFIKKQKYEMAGISDIICLYKGTFIAIEVKGKQKYKSWVRLSDEQQTFGLAVSHNGGKYYIVDSIEKLQDIFV